jgi:DNA-binding GntR family transcriptional regulator
MADQAAAMGMDEMRLTATDRVARALEEDILTGRLKPGVRLDEQALAKRFEVSRTPVREALRYLDSAGLIELRRNHGAIVRALTITELIEMFQVMAELEGLCARLSARRMNSGERSGMLRAHEICTVRARDNDHEGFFEANNALHEIIYTGSHSSFLQKETRNLRNRVNPYRRLITFQPKRMEDSVDEHQAVVDAIQQGEGETAHRLMRDHVNLLGESAADVITALNLVSDDLTALGGGAS